MCRAGWNFGRPLYFSLVNSMVLFPHFEEDKMHIVLKALDLILDTRALKEMQTFNLLSVEL